tara:strand:+ start:597 stop:791 length:195 start_codon:yes stop_codon:yes gene_type:complete
MDIHLYAIELALIILNGYAANREEALDLLDLSEDAARELEELLQKHLNGSGHMLGQPRKDSDEA